MIVKDHKRKPVCMLTLDGKILKRFPSMREASSKTGIPLSSISMVCSGINHVAGGYRWVKEENLGK